MQNASEIIKEVKKLFSPNEGVKALANMAYNDPNGFCIMDNDECRSSYREECLDRGLCHNPDFMLACLATRFFDQLGESAIDIYNNAI